jgi:hypothetical protein
MILLPCGALALLAGLGPRAQAGPAEPVAPPSISADGTEVRYAGLHVAWSRCVEGQHWDGRGCTGEALRVDQAHATGLAAARRRADGGAWRVPSLGDWQHLLHPRGRAPGLDARLFPAGPPGWHWSSTAEIDTQTVNPYRYGNIERGVDGQNVNRLAFLHGWAVEPASGEQRDDMLRRTRLPVRLVRPLD